MLPEVVKYLDEVRSHLHLDALTERRVIGELYTYFQEKVADLQEQGLSEAEATKEAIKSFGRARVVARLMYEAYSKGSWMEALIAALPHLIVAGLFATHLWRHPAPALGIFAILVGVTLGGWWHGKPNWLYSWIGYALLPLLITGFITWQMFTQAASSLLRGQGTPDTILSFALLFALYTLSLAIITSTTVRVVKRDWILASLMLVPLPILGIWLFNTERVGGLFQAGGTLLYQWDTAMASVLMVLAVATASFIRLRQRVLKAGALLTIGILAGAIAADNIWGNPGFLGLLVTSLLLLLFLLSPALLEASIGHGEARTESWWSEEWLEHPSMIE
ncbi:MAG TPA: hypothetical protein G4O01_05595 [Dehalococcoidia bacterium]|jgi:hypothetical protein|nr:hypothetical protein [Dehalococcoidia bacterium]